jgi:mono/diheme cytochrome c family protein
MWMEVSTKNVTRPALAETDWADVFAYLYSEQIFQFPAQVRRGEDVFRSKECAACHSAANGQPGLPVPLWKDVDDPAVLVYQMWNHAATMNTTMRATFDARKKNWPKMDGRDFGDLAAYVQSVQRLSPNRQLSLPEAASGKAAFGHYCEQCHQGPLALETRLANKTFLDIGAGVWNHVPQMGTGAGAFPTLSEADMRKILAYVWDLQVRGPEGNVTHGELAFAAKGCAGCHTDAQTHAVVSPRPGKVFTPFSMAAIAWGANRDVPSKMPHRMHREMWNQGAVWPTLSPDDVSDLAAFMNYASRR